MLATSESSQILWLFKIEHNLSLISSTTPELWNFLIHDTRQTQGDINLKSHLNITGYENLAKIIFLQAECTYFSFSKESFFSLLIFNHRISVP